MPLDLGFVKQDISRFPNSCPYPTPSARRPNRHDTPAPVARPRRWPVYRVFQPGFSSLPRPRLSASLSSSNGRSRESCKRRPGGALLRSRGCGRADTRARVALLALEVTRDSESLGIHHQRETCGAWLCRSRSPAPSGRGIFSGSRTDADVTARARLIHEAHGSILIAGAACVFVERDPREAFAESSAEQRRAREGVLGGDTSSRSSTEMPRELRARRCGLGSHHRRCTALSNEDTIRNILPSSRGYPTRSTERVRRGCGCRRRSVSSLVHEAWGASSARGACAGRDLSPPDPPAFKRARAAPAAAGSLAPLIDGTSRVPSLQGAATL